MAGEKHSKVSARRSRSDAFWTLAQRIQKESGVDKGTLMGNPCLRFDGKFLATIHRKSGDMVLKVTAERVGELIAAGTGRPFSPAGRVFSEWVAIPTVDPELWESLLEEALAIARGRAGSRKRSRR